MIFSDSIFLAVFPIFVAIYYLLPGRTQSVFLVAGSFGFLGYFGIGNAVFATAVALLVWTIGLIQRSCGSTARWPAAAALLAVLVIVKTPLSPLGHTPLGASYYIFVLLSIIWFLPKPPDLQLTLRSVFFAPHIIAGPISLARSFVPQLSGRKRLLLGNIFLGTQYLMLGYAKKLLIADPLALSMAPVWDAPGQFSSAAIAVAILAFYVQLYADFSGYTDMARGIARILGYRLPVNFRGPYLATTPMDFWRRWHVSLSTWIRLYLFAPLSMQVWRRVRAKWAVGPATLGIVVVVMVAVGLWHELSLRFLIFGSFHGVLIGMWFIVLRGRTDLAGIVGFASWALFQILLALSLVLFRSENGRDILTIFQRLVAGDGDGVNVASAVPGVLLATAVVFAFQWLEYFGPRRKVARWLRPVRHAAPIFPAAIAAIAVIMFFKGMSIEGVWVSPGDPFFVASRVPFIYARF